MDKKYDPFNKSVKTIFVEYFAGELKTSGVYTIFVK